MRLSGLPLLKIKHRRGFPTRVRCAPAIDPPRAETMPSRQYSSTSHCSIFYTRMLTLMFLISTFIDFSR